MPRSDVAGSNGIPSLLRNSAMIPTVAAPVCIPPNSENVFPFPYISTSIIVICFLDLISFDIAETKSQSCFHLHFTNG